jgi:hypothetical protein
VGHVLEESKDEEGAADETLTGLAEGFLPTAYGDTADA